MTRFICTIAFVFTACGFAQNQTSPANLAHIVRQLTDEAKQSRTDGVLARSSADFAATLSEASAPTARQLLEKITRRADSDAFIDAYVRWQLTSFKPTIDVEKLTDREFERLLDSLPAMIENPRADARLLKSLQAAVTRGTLSDVQQTEVNAVLNDLATRGSAARAMNVPALELRTWITNQFASQPHRWLHVILEHAQATATAGWPADEAKAAVDDAIARTARRREFTDEQRREFLRAAEQRMVRSRMFLVSAGVEENAVTANYGTVGIFDYDVRRWAKALADE